MRQKNDRLTLTVTGATAEGSGVAHDADSGMAIFLPRTAVGDTVECHIVNVQKSYAHAVTDQLVTPSPDRVEPQCPVAGRCGGCSWQHISYEAEKRYKWQRVADALSRIGGLSVIPEPLAGSDDPVRYRNKGQYPIGEVNGRPVAGFYAPRSHRIIEQHDCLLQPAEFAPLLEVVLNWMTRFSVPAYQELTHRGLIRHLYIRKAVRTGDIMVCLVATSGKLPHTEELVVALRETAPALVSVMVNLNREDTNVILGKKGFVLWGEDHITDELCGLTFRLSPLSFYQVNHDQAERLYALAKAAAGLTGREVLLDLYCGTGTIGLSMAAQAGQLIGADIVPAAIEDARRNAEANGIFNARFLCADAGEAAAQLARESLHPDVVIIDPPRKGTTPEVISLLTEAMKPDRIVYVSCDPATLSRDLKTFSDAGYTTKTVTPVDMFPRTPHVESVALLIR